jgi:hypothetical protein
LHTALARIPAAILKAALQAARKPTPDNPDGEIKIHPELKPSFMDFDGLFHSGHRLP